MDDLAHVILAILKKSDLIVVKDLQEGFDTDPDLSVETFRSWLDNLEDMQEKAEKLEEVENNLYWINDYVDEIESTLSQIREYTNV